MVPDCLKHASVTPFLKKPNLDVSVLSNFRPISNLPFISKVLEKVVFTQLQSFLSSNSVYKTFHSGYRKLHSTESALLKVTNDIMLSTDNGNAVALVLFDLSSAFDMVDHKILISRLESYVGIQGIVLIWFRSYSTNRKFSVCIGKHTSSVVHLSCGVPQGSILAPTLFSLYMLPLGSLFSKHGVSFQTKDSPPGPPPGEGAVPSPSPEEQDPETPGFPSQGRRLPWRSMGQVGVETGYAAFLVPAPRRGHEGCCLGRAGAEVEAAGGRPR